MNKIKGETPDWFTGSNHPNNTGLTEYQVKKIRELYKKVDISYQSIADLYGVSKSTIGFIIRQLTWRHVKSTTESESFQP